jgi:hypothetical protein
MTSSARHASISSNHVPGSGIKDAGTTTGPSAEIFRPVSLPKLSVNWLEQSAQETLATEPRRNRLSVRVGLIVLAVLVVVVLFALLA